MRYLKTLFETVRSYKDGINHKSEHAASSIFFSFAKLIDFFLTVQYLQMIKFLTLCCVAIAI